MLSILPKVTLDTLCTCLCLYYNIIKSGERPSVEPWPSAQVLNRNSICQVCYRGQYNSGDAFYNVSSGKDDSRIIVGTVEEEDSGCGACVEAFLLVLSMILIICTFPLSLFVTVKQVQEYQRAVIFRWNIVLLEMFVCSK